MSWRLALFLLALPVRAGADPGAVVVDLTYDGYRSGFHVLTLHSEMLMAPSGYRIALSGHTAGMVGLLYHANWQSWADGTWTDSGVQPLHFDTAGVFGGQPRHVAIEYERGAPVIHTLEPADDGEHTPVPPGMAQHTIDSLSITALVIHQVAMLGRCEGQVTTFDGRQLQTMALQASGAEYLPVISRSSWSGPTLRCELDAHVLAGFYRGDSSEAARIRGDTIWLGSVLPGVPPLPVRSTTTTHHLGRLTIYLTGASLRNAATLTAKAP